MHAKRSLGQNFLMHPQTARRIVGAASLPAGALVLEVGPGTGMLTKELLDAGMQVVAVEADQSLVPELESRFRAEIAEGRLAIFTADIRTFDTAAHLEHEYHVVANIPYYITGELIRQFLTAPRQPASMTLLVQKEVAERIARQAGKSPKESLLSLSVKAYGTPAYKFTVPRGAFVPAPTVDSAVLHIAEIRRSSFETREDEARFFALLHAGFGHKRKRLAKNLESVAPAALIAPAFAEAGLDANVRAEDLQLPAWLLLAKILEPA